MELNRFLCRPVPAAGTPRRSLVAGCPHRTPRSALRQPSHGGLSALPRACKPMRAVRASHPYAGRVGQAARPTWRREVSRYGNAGQTSRVFTTATQAPRRELLHLQQAHTARVLLRSIGFSHVTFAPHCPATLSGAPCAPCVSPSLAPRIRVRCATSSALRVAVPPTCSPCAVCLKAPRGARCYRVRLAAPWHAIVRGGAAQSLQPSASRSRYRPKAGTQPPATLRRALTARQRPRERHPRLLDAQRPRRRARPRDAALWPRPRQTSGSGTPRRP